MRDKIHLCPLCEKELLEFNDKYGKCVDCKFFFAWSMPAKHWEWINKIHNKFKKFNYD